MVLALALLQAERPSAAKSEDESLMLQADQLADMKNLELESQPWVLTASEEEELSRLEEQESGNDTESPRLTQLKKKMKQSKMTRFQELSEEAELGSLDSLDEMELADLRGEYDAARSAAAEEQQQRSLQHQDSVSQTRSDSDIQRRALAAEHLNGEVERSYQRLDTGRAQILNQSNSSMLSHREPELPSSSSFVPMGRPVDHAFPSSMARPVTAFASPYTGSPSFANHSQSWDNPDYHEALARYLSSEGEPVELDNGQSEDILQKMLGLLQPQDGPMKQTLTEADQRIEEVKDTAERWANDTSDALTKGEEMLIAEAYRARHTLKQDHDRIHRVVQKHFTDVIGPYQQLMQAG